MHELHDGCSGLHPSTLYRSSPRLESSAVHLRVRLQVFHVLRVLHANMLVIPLVLCVFTAAFTIPLSQAIPLDQPSSLDVVPNSDNSWTPNYSHFLLDGRALPTGTCDANTPCVNAACCGTNGLCGYSPTECGAGNCTSNCDAKAECGQYGKEGSQDCPLGVCCSQFG